MDQYPGYPVTIIIVFGAPQKILSLITVHHAGWSAHVDKTIHSRFSIDSSRRS
jgi:hypothetical protein